eukprot:jgi/Chrzof1/13667/Cz08g07110.t1
MRIAVIGSGVSGIVVAKTLLQAGHAVTVYEKSRNLGGVWNPDVVYPGAHTQNIGHMYRFTDFAPPKTWDKYPTATQVYDYLRDYATHNELWGSIRLSTNVIRIMALTTDDGRAGWFVTVHSSGQRLEEVFDFVVISTGTYCQPSIPSFTGQEEFVEAGGKVFHTSQLSDVDISSKIAGKSVAVVGFGKSALDVATYCTNCATAKSVTILYRQARWCVPKKLAHLIPYEYVLSCRAGMLLMPSPYEGHLVQFIRKLLKPFTWLAFRSMEMLISMQQGLRKIGMVPCEQLEKALTCEGSHLETDGFYDAIHQGKLKPKQGEIQSLSPGQLTLKDGSKLSADVLILGTGYIWHHLPFLDPNTRKQLIDEDKNTCQLYRRILPLNIPNLAFIGYQSSLTSVLTFEMGAKWLTAYLEGRIKPTHDMMQDTLLKERSYALRNFTGKHVRTVSGPCIAPYAMPYVDSLLSDMNQKPVKGLINKLKDFLLPWDASLYKDCR